MIDNIKDKMEDIKYGYVDIKGVIHNEVDDKFSEHYKLQTPDEVLINKIGVCWDQVELERFLFDKNNIDFKTYFIVYYDNDKCPTHTFLIYKDGNNFCWFEHSWEKYRGISVYNSELEALSDIRNKFINEELNGVYDYMNLCIYEYSRPEYGIKVLDFYKHCESGRNIIIN